MIDYKDQLHIKKVIDGDTNSFSYLVEKYKDYVFNLALKIMKNREEAEEISQDTFIKAFKNLSKFKGESKFSTWLYRITYRTALDRIKKNKNKILNTPIDEFTIHQIKSVEDTLQQIERKERAQIMNDCLLKLSEEERSILWLFYYEELTLKEIVNITPLSEANVKVKLHRGRKNLLTIVKTTVEPEIIKHYGRK